jgi:hypothetical protein
MTGDQRTAAKRGTGEIAGGAVAAYRRQNVIVIWAESPTATQRSEVDSCLAK